MSAQNAGAGGSRVTSVDRPRNGRLPAGDNPFMLQGDLPELGVVKIATPCPMRWSDMEGTGRERFCGRCAMNVYDFAGLDSEEARLLLRKGGRICARLFVRADGTVLTKDCPKGYPRALLWAKRFAVPAMLVPVLAVFLLVVLAAVDNVRRLQSMTGQLQLEVTPAPASKAPPRAHRSARP